jgi:transcriptional regulator with XRE-family HTH domain
MGAPIHLLALTGNPDRDRIITLRRKLKLSQVALGKLLGVSGNAVKDWELGRRNPSQPVLKVLEKIEREKAKQFNFLYWPVAGGISFWTQPGGKGKQRGSLVMIDRGNRIEVPLFHDDRLRLILRYAAEKWTTLKILGDENFVQKAETYAKELQIPVISQRKIMPNLFQYFGV